MGADITPSARAIVIAGPTASGKSALALALAERFGGVVINADSMQVYRDLRILTARPGDDDMASVPHRLFGHVDAAEAYSVGRWLDDMGATLAEARESGRRPIVVGGTGLYIKALIQGLSSIPPVPADVRQELRQTAETCSPAELYERLKTCDPITAAQLRATDPQRIIRALEVWHATGTPLAVFQQRRAAPLLPAARVDGLFLAIDRPALRQRIATRFATMIEHGALAELGALAARDLDPTLPAMRAIGIPPLLAHLRGEIGLTEAMARSITATFQFAKRQITFARHQLPDFRWIDGDEELNDLVGSAPRPG